MSGHSVGPWKVIEANAPGVLYIQGPSQTLTIITTAIDLDFSDYVTRTADANLIAAAPELLEALEGFMDLIGASASRPSPDVQCRIDKSRAAIAKAKGQPQ
ncbi:hypothetical protein MAJJADAN_00056 [Pseudomonas phage Amjad_SA]|nr:hypothetical protein MAJJADAN_00056 [Pseudomonas phage Amjad_SA]